MLARRATRVPPQILPIGLALSLAAAVCGCAGQLPPLQTGALAGVNSSVALAPLDVYFRIAEQSAICWFGPEGRLTPSHIYHASAPSPSTSGSIEIALHRRTSDPKKPWGPRAFVIQLSGSDITSIEFKNISLPLSEDSTVRSETLAWASGRADCKRVPRPPVAEAEPPPKPTKRKRKTKHKKPKPRPAVAKAQTPKTPPQRQ